VIPLVKHSSIPGAAGFFLLQLKDGALSAGLVEQQAGRPQVLMEGNAPLLSWRVVLFHDDVPQG
jgi:hypothetical protein